MPESRHHHAHCSWDPDKLAFGIDSLGDGFGYLFWRHREGRLPKPGGHLGLDEAWANDQHMYAVFANGFPQPEEETVEAGFRRAVNEVGAPYSLTGHAGQRHDPTVGLGAHALGEQHPEMNRCR